MTDNEVFNTVDACVNRNIKCNECPFIDEVGDGKDCVDISWGYLLSIINRQKAEIERLNEYISRCKSGEEYWVKCLLERPNEAIKEFAERLNDTKFWNGNEYVIYADNIDVLVKEMVGDDNADD